MNLTTLKQEAREEFFRNLLDRPAGSVADYEDYCRDISAFLDTLIDKVVSELLPNDEQIEALERCLHYLRSYKGGSDYEVMEQTLEKFRNFRGV